MLLICAAPPFAVIDTLPSSDEIVVPSPCVTEAPETVTPVCPEILLTNAFPLLAVIDTLPVSDEIVVPSP